METSNQKFCPECNKDISGKKTKYCSKHCQVSVQQVERWKKYRKQKEIERLNTPPEEFGYRTKKCEKCQKEFKPTSSTQRWCSNNCKNTSSKFICEACGKEFEKWSKSPHKVCSWECRSKLIAMKKINVPRVILKCYVCKKEFVRKVNAITSEHVFCCLKCRYIWTKCEGPRISKIMSKIVLDQIKNGRKIFNQNFEKGFFLSKKNNKPIYYRSSWEKLMYEKLENDENVIMYLVEPFSIQYINENNEIKKYYPDILVIYKDRKELVEIKPKSLLSWKVNKLKIKVAKKYCKKNDIVFRIITEDDLFEKVKN